MPGAVKSLPPYRIGSLTVPLPYLPIKQQSSLMGCKRHNGHSRTRRPLMPPGRRRPGGIRANRLPRIQLLTCNGIKAGYFRIYAVRYV